MMKNVASSKKKKKTNLRQECKNLALFEKKLEPIGPNIVDFCFTFALLGRLIFWALFYNQCLRVFLSFIYLYMTAPHKLQSLNPYRV